jgi:hypothetical protein
MKKILKWRGQCGLFWLKIEKTAGCGELHIP